MNTCNSGKPIVDQAGRLDVQGLSALINAGRLAPSPDNNQPWAFRAVDGAVEVHHVPERMVQSDVHCLFSWLALGAAIENVVLAASAKRWQATVEYHVASAPQDQPQLVARVVLSDGGEVDPLHEQIPHRVTNRRPYDRQALEAAVLTALGEAVRDPQTRVHWLSDRDAIRQAARCIQSADRIRFEHQPFHDELHAMLRFGQAEATRRGDGLELGTLEIPRLMGPVLRFLRPWPRMRQANRFGASRMFARIAAAAVNASGALALLTTSEPGDRGYLETGRSVQRLWLKATELGLAAQPLGSLPLFLLKLAVQPDAFQPQHAQRLAHVRDRFDELLSLEHEQPVMLLRLGRAPAPTARAPRYPLASVCMSDTDTEESP